MDMSSETFELLEEELRSLCETIDFRIEKKLISSPFGEVRKKLIQDLQRDLDEAQSFLQQMTSETRQAPLPYRSELVTTLRKHRDSVDQLSSRYKSIVAGFSDGR